MYMECVQPHPETMCRADIINLPLPPAAGCSLKTLNDDLPSPEETINAGKSHDA